MSFNIRKNLVLFFIFFNLLIGNTFSQLSILPTNYISNHDTSDYNIPYDDIFEDDFKNTNEINTYLVWIYAYTSTPYRDRINGILWENTASNYDLCKRADLSGNANIENDVFGNFPDGSTFSTNLITNKQTNLNTLYSSCCYHSSGLYFPLKFHYDTSNSAATVTYILMFKMMNPQSSSLSFNLLVQDFNNSSNYYTINTSVTINAYTLKTYVIKWNIVSSNQVTFYLQEENFVVAHTTPSYNNQAATQFFSNSNTGTNPNMKLYIKSVSGSVYISGVVFKINLTPAPSAPFSLTNNGSNCNDSRPCSPGSSCLLLSGTTYTCQSCTSSNCRTCDSGTGTCNRCYSTSQGWNTGSNCNIFDYVNFQVMTFSASNVPPVIHWRVSLDFWIFVHDTSKLLTSSNVLTASHVTYGDFMTLSITQGTSSSNLMITCTPFEFIYQVKSQNTKSGLFNYLNSNNAFYMSDNRVNAFNSWNYIRCAFSISHKKAYILYTGSETSLTVPQMYSNQSSFGHYFKKFYKDQATVSLSFDQFVGNISTELYIRNLNVFREYLPYNLDIKYFNLYKISAHTEFPQILFSIPFESLTLTTTSVQNIKLYDFSTEKTSSLSITNLSNMSYSGGSMPPPRNFKRLNFLDVNNQWSNNEMTTTTTITCNSPAKYCQYNNAAFGCVDNNYLNINSFTCNQFCPNGYMRLPDEINFNLRNYCSYNCPSGTTCPSAGPSTFLNIKDNFSCSAGFTNNFYKCSDSSMDKKTNLHFSSILNSQSISIDIGSSKNNYVLHFWIYPDLMHLSSNPLTPTLTFFKTDTWTMEYASPTSNFKSTATLGFPDTLILGSWNHVFVYSDNGTNVYSSATANLAYSSKKAGDGSFRYIYFCQTADSSVTACSTPATLKWFDAFYRDLRLWDATSTSGWAIVQYNNFVNLNNISSLIKYFTFDLSSMTNGISDSTGTTKATIQYNSSTRNPDLNNMFNYASNFSWNDMYSGQTLNPSYSLLGASIVPSPVYCDSTCGGMCNGSLSTNCLNCSPGYALYGNTCKTLNPTQYYFRSPPNNISTGIQLNLSNVDLTSPALTVSFFIKVYGFIQNSPIDYTIVNFDSTNNFILRFNPTSQSGSLSLVYNGVTQYEYQVDATTTLGFKGNYIGRWCPISIAMYRSATSTVFPNMHSMTIGYQLLYSQSTPYASFAFTQFKISGSYIGLISDVNIYRTFIINAWSIGKFYNDYNNHTKFLYYSFSLKGVASNSCLNDNIISGTTVSSAGISCVADYNPYFDYNCGTGLNSQFYVTVTTDTPACGKCTSPTTNRCLTNDGGTSNVLYNGCEFSTSDFIYNQLYSASGTGGTTQINCGINNGMDFHRFNPGTIQNISSPLGAFNLEFWFYNQSYVSTGSTTNFKNIEISWNFHMKTKIQWTSPNFVGSCYPLSDLSNPANDVNPQTVQWTYANGYNKWIYFTCGVDSVAKTVFASNSNTIGSGATFSSSNIIPSNSVYLYINEGSTLGYGMTLIRELRLWNCYSCNTVNVYLAYQQGYPGFGNVLHVFSGLSYDGNMVDSIKGVSLQFTQKPNWPGNNIVTTISTILVCNESQFSYYDPTTNACQTIYNLNVLNDFTFPNIPSSFTNRWTMDLWIWVEIAQQLTAGVNFIWENHLSISIIRDTSSITSLNAICFPQGYKDNIRGISSVPIYDVYNSATNKAKELITGFSSTWLFVRCSVDLVRGTFYINNTSGNIVNETLYTNVKNSIPYRFFNQSPLQNLIVQNASLNNSRIFMAYLTLYREYIPSAFINLKYKDMKIYATNFWPLVFTCDFFNSISTSLTLTYAINNTDNNTSSTSQTITLSIKSQVNYSTYPTFTINTFCTAGQKGPFPCSSITLGTPCLASNFCLDDNLKFWCDPSSSNKFMNMATNTCGTQCPTTYTRLPDSIDTTAYCLWSCGSSLNNACPNTSANLISAQYKLATNFSCNNDYTRVSYYCLLTSSVANSAIYFSNIYSFPPTIVTFSNASQKSNYYLEFWFRIDNINVARFTSNLYYFFGVPHIILRSISDSLFKYANKEIGNGNTLYTLSDINTYEWNQIVIHNYLDSNNLWNIFVYINGGFSNPSVSITGLNNTYDMKLKGILFCNNVISPSSCTVNSVSYSPTWGNAFYKNIRMWDVTQTSLYIIQSFGKVYNENLTSLYYNWTFLIDSISLDKLQENINPLSNAFTASWQFLNSYDMNSRFNFAVNFDFSQTNPTTYIVLNSGTTYVSSPCDPSCKRCYSAVNSSCYECNANYVLVGKTCIQANNYYFKTPSSISTPIISLLDNTSTWNINTLNPITITLNFKFYGINQAAPSQAQYYPIFYFSGITSYFGYDATNKMFVLMINSQLAFKYQNILSIIGSWVNIGISIYRSSNTSIFPNMLNFFIAGNVIYPESSFNIGYTTVTLDNLSFSYFAVCLFSNLKIYNNFYLAPYGFINGSITTKSKDFIAEYTLSSPSYLTCIQNIDLKTQSVSGIGLVCVNDYNPFQNMNIQCNNDKQYFTTNGLTNCLSCDNYCLTNCFSSGPNSCSCSFNSGLFWITNQISSSSYFCTRKNQLKTEISSINFANYNSITINNISYPKNKEYTLEFWVYIHTYTGGQFNSLDVIWDKTARMQIIIISNALKSRCYPYVDLTNLLLYPTYYEDSLTEKNWFYVKCAVTQRQQKYYTNSLSPKNYTTMPIFNGNFTTLTIVDNQINQNYGLALIRELKLLSNYDFSFFNLGRLNLTVSKYPYLLHFYENLYWGNDTLIDSVTGTYTPITKRSGLIGYNYIVGYQALTVCLEGQVLINGVCSSYLSTKCLISSDDQDNCISCPFNVPYLHLDGKCYSQCPQGFYADNFLKQCRECDSTCYTCNGYLETNCTSCKGALNLVPNLGICVSSCEAYGVTLSSNKNNTCIVFNCTSNILFPLNGTIVDPSKFSFLTAEVKNPTTQNFVVNWRYSAYETMLLNPTKNISPLAPFVGSTNNYTVFLNTSLFQLNTSYVFYFDAYTTTSNNIVTIPTKFIIPVNNVPQNGFITSLPSSGSSVVTNFFFSCKNWTDDNTNNFNYRFSFIDFNNNEQFLTPITPINEFTTNFTLPKGVSSYNYIVKCYCFDIFNYYNTTNITIQINSGLISTEIISNIAQNNDFNLTGITSDGLILRSSMLKSLVSNLDNSKSTSNRTEIGLQSSILHFIQDINQTFTLIKNIPNCTNSFCNNNGECVVIDKFLACNCDYKFTGTNCQLEVTSVHNLKLMYKNLYNKTISAISDNSTSLNQLFSVMDNLLAGASFFMDEQNYLLNITYFIDLIQTKYPTVMVNNAFTVFNFFDSIFGYLLYLVNNMKISNQNLISNNLALLNNSTLNISNTTNSTNYELTLGQQMNLRNIFSQIRIQLDSFMSFLAQNINDTSAELEYSNSNFAISFVGVNRDFNFSYFNSTNTYESWFDMSSCLAYTMLTNFNKLGYDVFVVNIRWKYSPYIYDKYLYFNNTSPVSTVYVLDPSTGKKIDFSKCKSSPITHYFPVNDLNMIDYINKKSSLLNPVNQYQLNDGIFSDPIYVSPNGTVINTTIKNRIDSYYININISCNYYNSTISNYSDIGMIYSSYSNGYFVCLSTHLTDLLVKHNYIPPNFPISGPFFYLKYFSLLINSSNYTSNYAFYSSLLLLIAYFGIIILFYITNLMLYRKNNIIDFLQKELIRINLPYLKNYNFNLHDFVSPSVRMRLDRAIKKDNQIDINKKDIITLKENDHLNDLNDENVPYEEFIKRYGERNHLRPGLSKPATPIIGNTRKGTNNKIINNFISTKEQDRQEDLFDNLYKSRENTPKKLDMLNDKISETKGEIINNNQKVEEGSLKLIDNIKKIEVNKKKEILDEDKKEEIFEESKRDEHVENNILVMNIQKNNENIEENEPEVLETLPDLKVSLNNDTLLTEFANIELTFCEFFCRNLGRRHIVISSFLENSILYSRSKRIGNFVVQCGLMMMITSFLYTLNLNSLNFVSFIFKKADISFIFEGTQITLVITFAIIASITSSVLSYFLSFIYYIPKENLRELYQFIKENSGISLLKKWEDIEKRASNLSRFILGISIHICIFSICHYCAFTFCSVYQNMNFSWLCGFIVSMIIDFAIFEVLVELLICFFFNFRRRSKSMLVIGEYLNRVRAIKTLT